LSDVPGGATQGRAISKTDVPEILHLIGAEIFGFSRGLGLLQLQWGGPGTLELKRRAARGGALLAV